MEGLQEGKRLGSIDGPVVVGIVDGNDEGVTDGKYEG